MSFIFRASLEVVYRIGSVGQYLSGIAELFLYLIFRTNEQRIRLIGPTRREADTPHDRPGFVYTLTAIVQVQYQRQTERRALVDLEFEINGPLSWSQNRDINPS